VKKCTTPRLPAWLHARILARDGRCPMHPVGVRATRRGGARVLSVPVTSTLLYFPVCRLHSILNILQTLRFEYAFSGFTRHSAPSASPRGPRVYLWPGLSLSPRGVHGQGGGKSTSDGYDSRCSYFRRWISVGRWDRRERFFLVGFNVGGHL